MPALYESIAQRFARTIQDGALRPGERLPSLRDLCGREGVSLMTALAVYRRLEALRLVEAMPRSGFRVLSARSPELLRPGPSRPRLAGRSTRREAVAAQVVAAVADPSLVPLGLGCPSSELYPLAALRRITGRLLAARPELWASYSPPPGDPELRRLIALRLRARGLEVGAGEVLITTGAMEALSLALRLLVRPGDLVAVERPTFFGILDAARAVGARVAELPGDPVAGVDPARLEEVCRQHPVRAAVLIPSFANPTGSLMSDERKQAWATLLRRRRVALIEDDLYGDLAFDGRRPRPMVSFAQPGAEPPSLLVGSLSKALLPGGRIGYLVARSPWIEKLAELKQATTLANATLPERVAAECLASGLFDRHLRRLVPRLEEGVRRLQAGVGAHFPPGTRAGRPAGGFVLWVELPAGCDGMELFHSAREAGISIAPGDLFSLSGGLQRFVRLNGGAGDPARVGAALATLGRLAAGQLAAKG